MHRQEDPPPQMSRGRSRTGAPAGVVIRRNQYPMKMTPPSRSPSQSSSLSSSSSLRRVTFAEGPHESVAEMAERRRRGRSLLSPEGPKRLAAAQTMQQPQWWQQQHDEQKQPGRGQRDDEARRRPIEAARPPSERRVTKEEEARGRDRDTESARFRSAATGGEIEDGLYCRTCGRSCRCGRVSERRTNPPLLAPEPREQRVSWRDMPSSSSSSGHLRRRQPAGNDDAAPPPPPPPSPRRRGSEDDDAAPPRSRRQQRTLETSDGYPASSGRVLGTVEETAPEGKSRKSRRALQPQPPRSMRCSLPPDLESRMLLSSLDEEEEEEEEAAPAPPDRLSLQRALSDTISPPTGQRSFSLMVPPVGTCDPVVESRQRRQQQQRRPLTKAKSCLVDASPPGDRPPEQVRVRVPPALSASELSQDRTHIRIKLVRAKTQRHLRGATPPRSSSGRRLSFSGSSVDGGSTAALPDFLADDVSLSLFSASLSAMDDTKSVSVAGLTAGGASAASSSGGSLLGSFLMHAPWWKRHGGGGAGGDGGEAGHHHPLDVHPLDSCGGDDGLSVASGTTMDSSLDDSGSSFVPQMPKIRKVSSSRAPSSSSPSTSPPSSPPSSSAGDVNSKKKKKKKKAAAVRAEERSKENAARSGGGRPRRRHQPPPTLALGGGAVFVISKTNLLGGGGWSSKSKSLRDVVREKLDVTTPIDEEEDDEDYDDDENYDDDDRSRVSDGPHPFVPRSRRLDDDEELLRRRLRGSLDDDDRRHQRHHQQQQRGREEEAEAAPPRRIGPLERRLLGQSSRTLIHQGGGNYSRRAVNPSGRSVAA